jgi:hypothetical protein
MKYNLNEEQEAEETQYQNYNTIINTLHSGLNIQKGFAELNGFYRHGFLLGPYFVEKLFLALKEMK